MSSDRLKRWGIIDDSNCGLEEESRDHLFLKCTLRWCRVEEGIYEEPASGDGNSVMLARIAKLHLFFKV